MEEIFSLILDIIIATVGFLFKIFSKIIKAISKLFKGKDKY